MAAEAINRSSSNLNLISRSNHKGSSSSGFNTPKSTSGSPYGSKANVHEMSEAGGGDYAMSSLGRDPLEAEVQGSRGKKGWFK